MALYCWGSTINGELGIGGVEEEHIVTPRELDWALADKIDFISSNSTHTLILTNDGKLYSCGQNDFGQLGHDQPRKRPRMSKFYLVNGLANHVITRACCGSSHSLAINEWGNLFVWGSNSFSQLGFSTENSEPMPKLVKALGTKHIVQIAAGNHHNIALTNEGELFAWGLNHSGQCGLGNIKKITTPTKISSLNGIPIAFIACGATFTFVISKSGAVFGFGKNNSGQLGIGDYVDRLYPTQLKTLRNIGVRHISAGEDFTVFLTQEGGVLTCGAGSYGQTAHGIKGNDVLPRMVFEMMGTICTQIACGSRHCLTFVPSRGRIYGFGLGSSGQLGNRSTNNALLPQIVVGPWASPSGQTLLDEFNSSDSNAKVSFVKQIFSGGDHSFAATSNSCENLHDCRFYDSNTQIECMTMELIEQCAKIGEQDTIDLSLMSSIEIIFRSLSCINGSFLEPNGGHTCCSVRNHGINIESGTAAFHLIQTMENQTLKSIIWDNITTQLLPTLVKSPPDVEALRIYLLLPLYHEFINVKNYPELHTPFGRSFVTMTQIARKVVMQWWAAMSVEYFEKLIAHFKNVVWYIMNHKLQKVIIKYNPEICDPPRGLIKFDIHLQTVLDVLKDLFVLNRFDREKPVPYETFYVPDLAESVHLQKDFCEYYSCEQQRKTGLFLSNYPFIFDAPAKILILQTDQSIQMCKAVHDAQAQSILRLLFVGADPADSNITFTISRERLVEDTINEIVKYKDNDLKKPLKVKFENEEGEDAGGVQKEFFMLLTQKLFSSEYGMFKNYDESRLIWFSDSSFEGEEMFQLVGTLVALALYNFQIINLPFPLALYKKILNERLKLSDLSELSPTLGNSMKSLLDYDSDDMDDVFDLTFEVTREAYDNLETVPLKDDGANIRVNQSNKKEFVDLYIDYVFNKSVKKQYTAFHTGFKIVCGGPVLNMFQAHELRDLLIGNENYNWDVFENNAVYMEGYKSSDPTIRLFWEVFHELPLEEKKKFLLFLTGSDRIPMDGMKAIRISIQPISDDKMLPVAHTCFNILDLPRYQTKEKLKFKLLQAIQHNQRFSLV